MSHYQSCHTMVSLDQLVNSTESALPFVTEAALADPGRCVIHPPSDSAGEVLYRTQVTTRSPMGAIAYHTGGISILHGMLRILGSGSPAIPRTLSGWNEGRSSGFHLVADDVFGGFFALNGGALGPDKGQIYYLSPDSLNWEPLGASYTRFLLWACSDFRGFYDDLLWPDYETAITSLEPDSCFFFHPPLWTAERVFPPIEIRSVPVTEAWAFKLEIIRQMIHDDL